MINLFNTISLLLSQTAKEKNLTLLYVGLFLFFLLMMVLDGQIGKKYTMDKQFGKIIIGMFLVVLIIFIILILFN